MYMLGYELEFGHMEAVTLLSSTKFHEKQAVCIMCSAPVTFVIIQGYLAMCLLLSETHEMIPLIINSLQEDLQVPCTCFKC